MSDNTSPGSGLPAAVVAAIKAERAVQGIPLGVLAKSVGIAPRTMTRYLNEEREMSLGMIDKFANALGMTLPELIRIAEQRLKRD